MRAQRVTTFNVPGGLHLLVAALALCCFSLGFSRPASAQKTYRVNAGVFEQSNAPISQTGGTTDAGGYASAGATIKAEAHAYAQATNVHSSASNMYSASAGARYNDLIITGPTPYVTVTIHLRFSALLTYSYGAMTDGVNSINSFTYQETTFGAWLGNTYNEFTVHLNRSQDIVDVTQLGVPMPRDPTLLKLDPAGFLRTYYRLVMPITAAPGYGPYAGASVDEIDELRGEMQVTATVPVGSPVFFDLNLNAHSRAFTDYILSAGGSVDATHTFGVPQDGTPVFDLPPGYNVSSASLGIVDNIVPPVGGGGPGGGGTLLPCPVGQGDWKNNAVWPVTDLTLGSQNYSQSELLQILQMPVGTGPGADASVILAHQLIAAKLNIASGSDPVPIASVIADADNLLSAFAGRLTYKVKPSIATGKLMTAAAAALELYNTQQLTPGCVAR